MTVLSVLKDSNPNVAAHGARLLIHRQSLIRKNWTQFLGDLDAFQDSLPAPYVEIVRGFRANTEERGALLEFAKRRSGQVRELLCEALLVSFCADDLTNEKSHARASEVIDFIDFIMANGSERLRSLLTAAEVFVARRPDFKLSTLERADLELFCASCALKLAQVNQRLEQPTLNSVSWELWRIHSLVNAMLGGECYDALEEALDFRLEAEVDALNDLRLCFRHLGNTKVVDFIVDNYRYAPAQNRRALVNILLEFEDPQTNAALLRLIDNETALGARTVLCEALSYQSGELAMEVVADQAQHFDAESADLKIARDIQQRFLG